MDKSGNFSFWVYWFDILATFRNDSEVSDVRKTGAVYWTSRVRHLRYIRLSFNCQ